MALMRAFTYLMSQMTRVVYLMRHPRVPWCLKVVPVLGVLYVVFPTDLLRDSVPVVGQIDDFWVVVMTMGVFLSLGTYFANRPQGDTPTMPTTYEILDDDRFS